VSDNDFAEHLRTAKLADVARVAFIHREAFTTAMPYLPALHTPEEDLDFFHSVVRNQHVVLATSSTDGDERVDGFVAVHEHWVNHLYVSVEWQRRGIGSSLIEAAKDWHKRVHPTGALNLWTFQRNSAARRFYHQHGFAPVEFTDGRNNEEQEPDVRFQWRPR